MKFYKVFKKEDRIEFVKEGFSWVAFLYTWIWALVKKQWKPLWIYLAGFILFFAAGAIGTIALTIILLFGLRLYMGLNGNKWLQKDLERQGFKEGRQKIHAEDKYVAKDRLPTFKNMFPE